MKRPDFDKYMDNSAESYSPGQPIYTQQMCSMEAFIEEQNLYIDWLEREYREVASDARCLHRAHRDVSYWIDELVAGISLSELDKDKDE